MGADRVFHRTTTSARKSGLIRSFLAPCPASGLIINGTHDRVAPPADTTALVGKLHEQQGITITHEEVEGADHFFREPYMDGMIDTVSTYVKRRLTETTR